ncbi:MAG: hypothetical protein ACRDGS_08835 [Chloroflexota bacterium]
MNLHELLNEIQVDPKFVEGRTPTDRMCEGCLIRRAEHIHHKEHKAMGGRKGLARTKSESNENKIALCEVCHRASHGLKYFSVPTPVYPQGFHCGVCPRRFQCLYGARLLGLPTAGLTPPW